MASVRNAKHKVIRSHAASFTREDGLSLGMIWIYWEWPSRISAMVIFKFLTRSLPVRIQKLG